MSVSLIKKSRSAPQQLEEIPIATNVTFERYWLSGARELGLSLVPLLWAPFYPDSTERTQLLTELHILRHWASGNPMADESQSQNMVERIDALINALSSDAGDDTEYCFG
jgi:hypothetical protein